MIVHIQLGGDPPPSDVTGMVWWTDATYPYDPLGFIPSFLSPADPRPAVEQLDANYAQHGGWQRFDGFAFDPKTETLRYPGDPPMRPVAATWLRDEKVLVYRSGWVLVVHPDETWEVARMD